MQKTIYLLFVFFLTCISISSQTVNRKIITLDELLELADEHNRELRILSYQEQISKEVISDEKKNLLPSIEANLSFSYNGDGSVIDRNFSKSIKAEIPSYGNSFAIEASQIIYAGGAIKSAIRKAEINHSLTQLEKEKVRQEIRFLIIGYYLDILKLDNQKIVLEQNITQTKTLLEQIKSKYNEGIILSNNVTRYELQLQSLELAKMQVENKIKIANNDLVKLVSLPDGTVLDISDEGINKQVEEIYNDSAWKSIALTESPILKKSSLKLEESKQNENLVKSETRPQVFAFAFNNLTGPITIEIPAIDKNFNYWTVGIGIKYNIGNLYKSKSRKSITRLTTKLVEEDNLRIKEDLMNTIDDSYINFLEVRKVYEIQQKSIILATENYEIIRNRYLNDLVLITEMLDAENAKLDAELKAINAQMDILFHFYKLKKITGTL